jgi:hypothetical protein
MLFLIKVYAVSRIAFRTICSGNRVSLTGDMLGAQIATLKNRKKGRRRRSQQQSGNGQNLLRNGVSPFY